MRTGMPARTVGRGICELPQLPGQTRSLIGYWLAPPQKGRNRGRRGDYPGGVPHPVQDGWNSSERESRAPLAVELWQRDRGGGM